jgi:hypothetical protein
MLILVLVEERQLAQQDRAERKHLRFSQTFDRYVPAPAKVILALCELP